MKWGGEINQKPFSEDVKKALDLVGKIKGASENPTGVPVVVYEYPGKWWKLKGGKPVTYQVTLDPTNQAELIRFQNLAKMFEDYIKDPDKHKQIGPTLKRTFEEGNG